MAKTPVTPPQGDDTGLIIAAFTANLAQPTYYQTKGINLLYDRKINNSDSEVNSSKVDNSDLETNYSESEESCY